ncbi:H(+)/Cl(-) exchange transporter-like protein [Hapsidospora chrysogenum ATCC 11550]|uniref:Chloride channel protein n=1 Tax=Hapsidospora chrysogenum (strain ATCC 11550 / CBS 779.69 / DSM 880 / IAM 14645 / JCM 23072 / IMI 49137) TaxID=857340 RepID=A0A086SUF4_HAPC1|nr:H(+)/Cl(-) exchange transporter-like protein [Hapsidospora chrysogenum ATCC 11550]
MPVSPHNTFAPSASSSSHSPGANTPTHSDDRDEVDFLGTDDDDDEEDGHRRGRARQDRDVLDDDPIQGELGAPMSFKRRHRASPSLLSGPARLLSALSGPSRTPTQRTPSPSGSDYDHIPDTDPLNHSSKNGTPLDWYIEGPGRRVGYEDLTAIDWIFEYNKERQRLRSLASSPGIISRLRHLVDSSQVWIILLFTGVSVGAIAAAINIAADWLADLKLGYCSSGPEGGHFYLSKTFCCYGYDQGSKCEFTVGYIFYFVFSIIAALCAALLVQEYAFYAKHSGIPEIKTVLGGFVIRRFLGGWTLLTKSFGLVLAVASGMWLGKEGPLVHVACCCANVFTKPFPSINGNEARKREQLSYYFPDKTMWQSFVCAMAAAVSLQAFDPFRSGKLVLYQTKYSTDWHGFEIIPYIFLGIFGATLFIKANMAVHRWKKATTWLPGPVVQVFAVALLTAVINYPNFYMKSQKTELVSSLFAECSQVLDDELGLCKKGAESVSNIVLLVLAAVIGFFLATITFGLHIPAGVILPSMAIGALTGRALGILMEMWFEAFPGFFLFQSCAPDVPCVVPGTYAIVGAAAALAGVTRMTVSIVVIMFELTGAVTYVLPIMVAVMISKWVGDAFGRRGIYESWIHFNEYPFLDNSEETFIPDVPVSQIMTRIEDLVVLTATGHTIASLTSILEAQPYRGFPVVSDTRDAVLLGYISRAELSYNIRAASHAPRSLPPETEAFFSHQPLADPRTTLDLRPWMDHTPLTLPSRTALHLVVSYFQKLGLRYVLFVDRGALQGILTKKDVWYVLNGAEDTRRTTSAAGRGGPSSSFGLGAAGRGAHDGEQRGLLHVDDDEYHCERDEELARERESML